MRLSVEFLREIASEVRRRVLPLLGAEEAWKPLGRGAGGDRTRLIEGRSKAWRRRRIPHRGRLRWNQ